VSHLTKTETSFVIWLNNVTIVAYTHSRRRPSHSSISLSVQTRQTCRKRCFSSQHLFR